MTAITVPISVGEFIDKITILEIKKIKLTSMTSIANVIKELSLLNRKLTQEIILPENILELKEKLFIINSSLWEIEDALRLKEKLQEFDDDFIHLARSVYKKNDQRALIKRQINILMSSDLIEEKGYAG
jgi:Family of unknown function (DUF6165)